MPAQSLPFYGSYWGVPGRLLAGIYPGDIDPGLAERKLAGFVRCGVGLVINLMEAHEVNWDGKLFVDYCPKLQELAKAVGRTVCCQRMSIRDADVPLVAHMRTILDAIDAAGTAGQVVYVHCLGGKGRTGTVVGCYLARHGLATGEAALDRLNELTRTSRYPFGCVPQTERQREFVQNWVQGQ